MTVAESAAQADMRSVCIICTTVYNISADAGHHVGVLAMAEPLVGTAN